MEVVDGLLCRIETSGEHADAQAGVLSAVRGSYHRSSGGDVRGGGWWIVDPAREEVTILRWSLEGYVIVEVSPVDGVLRAPPFEQAEIRVAGLFGKD